MRIVITYGTFDLFHHGHYNILKRAKEQGDYLIVGVTSESYDIDRGKLSVHDSLPTRIQNVEKTGFADKIIVEEYLGQKVRDIIKYNVDVLVVGSDWIGKFDHLRQYCEVIYLERTKNISSTQIRESATNISKIGIITDNDDDKDFVLESKYVSGLHTEKVYSTDAAVAEKFADKYQLNQYTDDLGVFFEGIDIVYIKSSVETRYDYIKKSLENGKNIICDYPFSYSSEEVMELRNLAKEKGLILLENIVTVYLKGFNQLLWLVKSNYIGKIIDINASISYDHYHSESNDFNDLAVFPVCTAIKMLGAELDSVHKYLFHDDEGNVKYGSLSLKSGESSAHIQIGRTIPLDNKLTIVGETGTIEVFDDWWNTGYYKIRNYADGSVKRQCFGFEGNGFRYLIQELLVMMNDKRNICTRLFDDEACAIVDILAK